MKAETGMTFTVKQLKNKAGSLRMKSRSNPVPWYVATQQQVEEAGGTWVDPMRESKHAVAKRKRGGRSANEVHMVARLPCTTSRVYNGATHTQMPAKKKSAKKLKSAKMPAKKATKKLKSAKIPAKKPCRHFLGPSNKNARARYVCAV